VQGVQQLPSSSTCSRNQPAHAIPVDDKLQASRFMQ
jgi:hypothetical protein